MESKIENTSSRRVALVTGANKGIGLAIAKGLAQDKGLFVLLGCRDVSKGESAVKDIGADHVRAIKIDVTDVSTLREAVDVIKRDYGGLDVLVNNAAIAFRTNELNGEIASETIKTNYHGVVRCMDAFLPLIRPGGRVVNLSSSAARKAHGKVAQDIQRLVRDDNLRVDQLTGLMDKFVQDVKNNQNREAWADSAYGMSKLGVTVLTKLAARDNTKEDVLINCCHPGYVRTDMTGPHADRSPEEGADTAIYLATLPKGSPSGKYWADRKVEEWL